MTPEAILQRAVDDLHRAGRLQLSGNTKDISVLIGALQNCDWARQEPTADWPAGLLRARKIVLERCGVSLQRI
ncbi:hypothetical protein HXX76_014028 [Chlamydomonas incerta]|uniref:Uncharacterized protein n=1 Tax=Chlamydomonas incerta TaxID=51695 RepID=A0A835SCQ3_CHLIN|nr:hypothetical protein HXX76_014028 [Chlamydomonas incerta]|eukprot:KAG2424868.1 hypothetical protein HXX76_014028 [Chlamydomonas incerta]